MTTLTIASHPYPAAYWNLDDLSGPLPKVCMPACAGQRLIRTCADLPIGARLIARGYGVRIDRLLGEGMTLIAVEAELKEFRRLGRVTHKDDYERWFHIATTVEVLSKRAVLLGDAREALPNVWPFAELRDALLDACALAYLASMAMDEIIGSDTDAMLKQWAFPADGRVSQRATDHLGGFGSRSIRRGPLRLPRLPERDHPWQQAATATDPV